MERGFATTLLVNQRVANFGWHKAQKASSVRASTRPREAGADRGDRRLAWSPRFRGRTPKGVAHETPLESRYSPCSHDARIRGVDHRGQCCPGGGDGPRWRI